MLISHAHQPSGTSQRRCGPLGRRRALTGIEVVGDDHTVAKFDQLVDNVRADEPGAAGDQDLHTRQPTAASDVRPEALDGVDETLRFDQVRIMAVVGPDIDEGAFDTVAEPCAVIIARVDAK
jgi:hypothetical protein